jgi:hypothetical protein
MPEPLETTSEHRAERRWALLRVVLGCAQMFGAAFSVVLVLETGVSPVSLTSVAITCSLTSLSVLLFGRRRGGRA